ncbi:MAG TPA: 4a-hydroxytetrahydrobiopterin dehydratase [Gemmatimonadaceae bacterium]|nr:4a-hydroxytetrahydrobiopterin dehydratase [Gemmatimonadaceae bacterium]
MRYTKLVFTLSTHDAGGVTQKDVELARAIEKVAR